MSQTYEKQLYYNTIGIDEVGKGAIAGPVVAAAVLFDKKVQTNQLYEIGVNDSKLLSKKQRNSVYEKLLKLSELGYVKYGIGLKNADKIDNIGIVNATSIAMQKAISDLCSSSKTLIQQENKTSLAIQTKNDYIHVEHIVIDGIYNPFNNIKINGADIDVKTIVKGDYYCYNIGAASIIAKVFRDKLMCDIMEERYGCYSWNNNSGYGTKKHVDAILENGLSEHHRFSFCKKFTSLITHKK